MLATEGRTRGTRTGYAVGRAAGLPLRRPGTVTGVDVFPTAGAPRVAVVGDESVRATARAHDWTAAVETGADGGTRVVFAGLDAA